MEVVEGDLWDFHTQGWYVVVPTNCVVRADGRAVMGRGVAQQAARRFRRLASMYGSTVYDHTPFVVFHEERLVMFPVKLDWKDRASMPLIEASCIKLRTVGAGLYKTGFRAALPLVGCGFGELSEEEVLPVLHRELPQPYFTLVKRSSDVRERYPDSFKESAREDRS